MPMTEAPIITVFGSSSPRTPAPYCQAAEALGRAIAERGWILRNGAGADGCMGAMTDGALAADGRVEGINLQHFVDQGWLHPRLQSLRVAENMRQRKQWLGAGCSAYVVLPGGPGTWEELWEVAVERQIGVHRLPLIVCDLDDYWQGLRLLLQRAAADDLLYGPHDELLTITDGVAATMEALAQALDMARS